MPIEFKVVVNKDLFQKLKKASNGQIEKEIPEWLDAVGTELLNEVQNEIIGRGVVDTRKLLQSFAKDDTDNIWRMNDEKLGFTLEVGSSLHYARYVNDGHWANPKGVSQRFVPGVWNGEKFQYMPGAKTGMVLKQQWIDARPYWTSAMRRFGPKFREYVNAKFRQWIRKYLM